MRPGRPDGPARPAPFSRAAPNQGATRAIHECPAGRSPGCLELSFVEHRFAGLSQELARAAKLLPGLARSFRGCRWGRKPSDDLPATLDVDRFAPGLHAADELQAARTELGHRDGHDVIVH